MAVPTVRRAATKYYSAQITLAGTANDFCLISILARGRVVAISVGIDVACTTTATVITPTIRDTAAALKETLGTITLGATQAALTTVTKEYASGGEVDFGDTIRILSDGGTATTPVAYVTVAVAEGGG